MMAAMTVCKCKNCGTGFQARLADVKRGWARFCSKSCKAKRQEARTGQFARYQRRQDHQDHDYRKYENDFHIMDSYSLGQD